MTQFSWLAAVTVATTMLCSNASGQAPSAGTTTASPPAAASGGVAISQNGPARSSRPLAKPSQFKDDPTIDAQDKVLDRKIRSICRGC